MTHKKSSNNALMVTVVLFWICQYIFVSYQAPFLSSLGTAQWLIGIVVGTYGLAQLFLRLPVGYIADRGVNHKHLIASGILITGIACGVRMLFPTTVGFFIGNLLSGVAGATWLSFMTYYLSQFSDAEHLRATTRIVMLNNLGMFLAFVLSSAFYHSLGMQFVCGIGFVAGLVGFLLTIRSLESQDVVKHEVTKEDIVGLFKNKQLIGFSLLAMVQQGVQMSTTMSFTSQVLDNIGASDGIIGFSTIFYMFFAVVFAQIGTMEFMDRVNQRSVIFTSFLLVAVYCFLVPMMTQPWFIIGLQLIPSFATGILFSNLTSNALSAVPQDIKSTGTGLFQAIYAAGITLFPSFTGMIDTAYSMKTAFWVLGSVACLTAIIFYFISRSQTKLAS